MTFHVSDQIRLVVILAVAIVTIEVALAEVARLVGFEVRFLGKGPATQVAKMWLLFVVHSHVGFERAALRKTLIADLARIGSFPSMYSCVYL